MSEFASSVDASELALRQAEREPLAIARAAERVRALQRAQAASAQIKATTRMVDAARSASTASKRVNWLQRAASAWGKAFAEVAACRKGCSHCCQIPVTISTIEAALIGRAIGRKPMVPRVLVRADEVSFPGSKAEAERALREGFEGRPCVFLLEGACSIYEDRPFACRTLFNLDDDPLLCEVVPGRHAEVPHADATFLHGLYAIAQPRAELADIRAFFG